MIEYTASEIRARYRQVVGDLPDDEMLIYKYGDATIGAALLVAPDRLSALDEALDEIRQEGGRG